MAEGLSSAPVAFLAAGLGADYAVLVHTWQAVLATGGQPVLVSPSRREVELWQALDRTGSMLVDVDVADANVADFAGLVLPGGAVNADQLRASPLALSLVRGFFAAGRPVAAICRAPSVLLEAGVVAGAAPDLVAGPALAPAQRRGKLGGRPRRGVRARIKRADH